MRKLILCLLAMVIALFAIGNPALAGPSDSPVSVIVTADNNDLVTPVLVAVTSSDRGGLLFAEWDIFFKTSTITLIAITESVESGVGSLSAYCWSASQSGLLPTMKSINTDESSIHDFIMA